jgi:hypothetical protein
MPGNIPHPPYQTPGLKLASQSFIYMAAVCESTSLGDKLNSAATITNGFPTGQTGPMSPSSTDGHFGTVRRWKWVLASKHDIKVFKDLCKRLAILFKNTSLPWINESLYSNKISNQLSRSS